MINPTEQDEREYLEEVKEKLLLATQRVDERVKQFAAELQRTKAYIHEHQSGLDEADMVAAEQSINRMAFTGESAVALKRKLMKLHQSPYFGRIDFAAEGAEPLPVYIGIHTFSDEASGRSLIFDWRAPISSMFYDFELGTAFYETPSGQITGNISVKRQYRIRDGRMEFMIENDVNIHDEVLQRELSKAADDKMKTIVATIQRDQNAVIRNESSTVMIIQGVAGSGKTSIALHRIAFLLYRFRNTIEAKDILIISPNKIFADYISSVLPELGEEQIPETGMDELAHDLLGNDIRFQTFFQQVAFLLETHDAAYIERVRFKADFEFLRKLNQYLIHLENNFFQARELRVGRVVVPSPFIHDRFKAHHRIPLLKRMPAVVKDIQQFVRDQTQSRLSGKEKAHIWQTVPQMLKVTNVFDLYRSFYTWLGKPELFHMAHGNVLEYADVFPLIYCRIRMEGVQPFDHVKHLIIDEMQDYTPVQYSVVSRMFKCRKTILGDISQTVNPYSGSSMEGIHQVFPQADVIKLFRSYRSTLEIIEFTQRILPNADLIPMERHGPQPAIRQLDTGAEEIAEIRRLVSAFRASGHHSMAIITKTNRQAKLLFGELKSSGVHLLSADSTSFRSGVVITTAHLAKGLEFDEVVVPFTTARDYHTEIDRRMLYVACTRAMHSLTLTCSGKATTLLL
ncbi:MAG TPA: 3'-5' exonuclease [Chryseosolibacter sp.]|nr:3'-5' exonuclease [Chryseosolibacter sp.]